ncbi:flagellar basal body rod protein FlgB [Inediibacterium massiliense]|uniref:flagellar basal body rod protein FlgB n=1 Tax=Inediibacterium massiliense TaxID=1658111 RepID=UPI0006B55B59|nr:flagellar basal body rod protein FlgB [Inediibacterium massiliense]
MDIFDQSFGNINILKKSLDASWMRDEAISNNIANVNTPKYKRNMVQFESILKENLSTSSIQGTRTHEKHFSIGKENIDNIEPISIKDLNGKYRKDGNNVDADVEMAELAKNTIQFNLVSQRINSNFRKLKMVIKDGR